MGLVGTIVVLTAILAESFYTEDGVPPKLRF
jgi:hypothetical protein